MTNPMEIVGCKVERTMFDKKVYVCLDAVDAVLEIDAQFLLRDAAGAWYQLDPGTGRPLAPALDLLGQTVETVEVRDNGALYLTLSGGLALFIGQDGRHSPWRLYEHGAVSR